MYELCCRPVIVVRQESQVACYRVRGDDGCEVVSLHAERLTLTLQDARAQFPGHVSLAVFVQRHQLVHAEDVQFHRHHDGVVLPF